MRFAFVTTNLAGGGAEKALLKTAAALRSRGNEADIWLLEDKIEHAVPAGVPIYTVGCTSHGWLNKRLTACRLRDRIRARDPYDLIVSTLPFADEVTHLAKLPHHWCRIANTLSAEIESLSRINSRKAARRQARYLRLYSAHPLIAVSEGVTEDLRQNLQVPTRIETIPNPFDMESIADAAHQSTAVVKQPYVLHVGRFATQKRHDLLLDAWTKVSLPHTLVLLTSPDPRLDSMIKARNLSGHVIVAGFQENPYTWMAAADLLVLCSDHEGLPNVLIESLLCGTPVVSTDCPSGPREILSALPECLVPCDDADALSIAITRCLDHPPDISRVDLRRYSVSAVAAAYERLGRI